MSFPKVLMIFALVVFLSIGVTALFKGDQKQEIFAEEIVLEKKEQELPALVVPPSLSNVSLKEQFPDTNRIEELFNVGQPKLPIVETLSYSSHVPWKKGQPAWVSDYASHYHTSRHFIARSLNGAPDYERQTISNGDRFNVFKLGKPISFHLVVDTSRCKMWFYCLDEERGERILLKRYDVGLGRPDPGLASGLLTPLGTYTLGDRVSIHRAGKMGTYNNEPIEMLTVYGTRWIPFEREVAGCTAPAKGLGLHGCPWMKREGTETWVEDVTGIGTYVSDGCIRLKTEDVEELFAIIITKPTTMYLVKDFFDAKLPGTSVVE
ncbi:MAG: L,D-transpeptidase [Verrucomicrobia bacterium]|nr:L,D-transpeptidase [Verrucomicrobiota bacterium]